MNPFWIFSVHPPNETAVFDDMVSSDWVPAISWVPKKCGSQLGTVFRSSLLVRFFIFLKVLQLFLFCLFQMEKKTNSQLFPNTSGHILVCNPYNYILYVCIITSSGYTLGNTATFPRGTPQLPTREAGQIFVCLGTHRVWKQNIRCCPVLIIYFSKRKPPRWFFTLKNTLVPNMRIKNKPFVYKPFHFPYLSQ